MQMALMGWMVFFSYFLMILQTTLIAEVFPNFLRPDLMIAWVTYIGIAFSLIHGIFFVLFCGLLSDTFSGSPFGLFMVVYLAIFLLIKLLERFIIIGPSPGFRTLLVAFSLAFQTLGLSFFPWGLGISKELWSPPFFISLLQGIVTCALAWPLLRFWEKMTVIFKETPAQPIS